MMKFVLKMMNCVLKLMNSKGPWCESCRPVCIKHDEFSIIKRWMFHYNMMDFALQMMDFALNMMDFASKGRTDWPGAFNSAAVRLLMHFYGFSCIFMGFSCIFMGFSCISMGFSCIFMGFSCIFMGFSCIFHARLMCFLLKSLGRGQHSPVAHKKIAPPAVRGLSVFKRFYACFKRFYACFKRFYAFLSCVSFMRVYFVRFMRVYFVRFLLKLTGRTLLIIILR